MKKLLLIAVLMTGLAAFAINLSTNYTAKNAVPQPEMVNGPCAYVGEVVLTAGNHAPIGWAFCDGQLLDISDYPDLYVQIGTTYGGDGVTTFRIPNLTGRVPVHKGTTTGITPKVLGDTGGVEFVSLTVANLPKHAHTVTIKPNASTEDGDDVDPEDRYPAQLQDDGYYSTSDVQMGATEAVTDSVGGNVSVINMQPYLVLNYMICLKGINP